MISNSEEPMTEIKALIDNDPLGVLYTEQEIAAVNRIAIILKENGVDLRERDFDIILDFFDEKVHDYQTRMKVVVTEIKLAGKRLRGKLDLLRTGQRIAEYFFKIDEKTYEITSIHKNRTEIQILSTWGGDIGKDLEDYYDEYFHAA